MSLWDRTNPYEGPTPCECGHDYGQHYADPETQACSLNRCECEAFRLGSEP